MISTVDLETTIPSYLAAWRSRDLIVAGHQESTKEWWDSNRSRFSLYISPFVIEELGRGDENAAMRRLELIKEIPILTVDDEVGKLTNTILKTGVIPFKAILDALHIAVATRHGMDYLLTWNCTHIANAEIMRKIEDILGKEGYIMPVICTPDELMGGLKND